MKINNIGYLLKEGIRGIFLHGFMSFAAVCVTVACLLIVGLFSCLVYNLNVIVERLNVTNQVIAYVDDAYSDAEAMSIGSNINRIANVQESVFVHREDALDNFIANFENPESFSGLDKDTLQHRYNISLMDNHLLDETRDQLLAIPGVVEVEAADELANAFATAQDVLEIVSILIIGILLVVSLLIISNTVKLAMYDRRDEIAIMKMVGATNGFIRLPFVVEGFTLGMIGAAVSFGIEWLLYDGIASRINQLAIASEQIRCVEFSELLWFMVAIFVGAGMFVGVVGSWTSIRKFMNV